MTFLLPPSFRRQQLALDFSFLRDHCPGGLYLSLTPGDASLWIAVFFVRKGPYEGAILRFQLSFPDAYPDLPPLITFSSDLFHPLVVPLTTYTFTANAVDASATVSASDENRLPPGAFSLRHGFPTWFSPVLTSDDDDNTPNTAPGAHHPLDNGTPTPEDQEDETERLYQSEPDQRTLILKVLRHLQHSFENEDLLDNIPLEAAGDPSAWHAWRAYRGFSRNQNEPRDNQPRSENAPPSSPKNPSEWKWDGVWESRVRNAVEASISEAALFGSSGPAGRAGRLGHFESIPFTDSRRGPSAIADRQIRFAKLNEERFEELKNALAGSVSAAAAS